MSDSPSAERLASMLDEHDFGVLATSGMEYPHTSLITIAVSGDHDYLVFPTSRETRKYANLSRDGRVSILLDNRSAAGKAPGAPYALSVLGTAREAAGPMLSECKERFLLRHPRLSEFVSLPQTALVQVIFSRIIIVEEFQDLHEIAFPLK